MQEFRMPALGADMEKGKLVAWNVAAGAHVKPGDVVAVVETQKGAIDVEIFLEGTIEDLVPIGTELPVGGVLAQVRSDPVGSGGEPPKVSETSPSAAEPATPGFRSAPPPAYETRPRSEGAHPQATPGARRRAQELGIPLATLHGTGPDGSITVADVETRAPVAQQAPTKAQGFDVQGMRAAIAAAMAKSKREIPHYYLSQAIDFTAAERWVAGYNAERAPADRLLPAVLLLKATALALAEVPGFNGFYRDGRVEAASSVHAGWAIALRGGGLVVPAVHDADRLGLADLMAALRDVVQRAREGRLRSSELTDATVTVTNLGDRGADEVLGVIYPPQLAIVGFGRVAPRPWVVDGAVAVRSIVQASLAADHRASDGHLGARFLAALTSALEDPGRLERTTP